MSRWFGRGVVHPDQNSSWEKGEKTKKKKKGKGKVEIKEKKGKEKRRGVQFLLVF